MADPLRANHIPVITTKAFSYFVSDTYYLLSFQGLMNLPGRPVAAFDPEGLIFAAGINSESLKLYDLRSFDKVNRAF